VWRRDVESLGTIVALEEWSIVLVLHCSRTVATYLSVLPADEPLCIVATHCERAAGLRCAGAVLQSACPHVLLAFNGPLAACLAGARHRPCVVAPWKIHARPDRDHDGQIAKGYLFTLMAHSP
jgi:hypothetical protein